MITRRHLLTLLAFAPLASGCKRDRRCSNCGMKIDATSPWYAEIALKTGEVRPFDTPRCALTAWLALKPEGAPAGALRVQDFYDRAWHDANEVRFVTGSDVLGPMGADLVPVMPDRAAKFAQDHGGRAYSFAEVTTAVLEGLK